MARPADGFAPTMVEQAAGSDSGLVGLVTLLRYHGIGVDADQIRHRFSTGTTTQIGDMLRCARALGLKARCLTSNWERLARVPLPAVASARDRRFFILAKVATA